MFTLTIATKLISFLLNIRLAQFFYIDLLIFSAFDLQLFSVLFFFMLFVLGIGSNIAMCTCVITILRDRFKALKAWQAAIGLSTFGFLFGLVYVTPVSNFIHLKQINKRLELFRNETHVSSQQLSIELMVTQIINYLLIYYSMRNRADSTYWIWWISMEHHSLCSCLRLLNSWPFPGFMVLISTVASSRH